MHTIIQNSKTGMHRIMDGPPCGYCEDGSPVQDWGGHDLGPPVSVRCPRAKEALRDQQKLRKSLDFVKTLDNDGRI